MYKGPSGQDEYIGEESKLEQKFNLLAVNLPKSSKHDSNKAFEKEKGGSSQYGYNKSIPDLEKVLLNINNKPRKIAHKY